MRRSILGVVLAVAATGCIHANVPDAGQMSDDVERLQATFAVFDELDVAGFRNQDWCQFIDYPRGSFTNVVDPDSTRNLFNNPPQAFDEQASTDFDRVKQVISDTGVSTYLVWNIEYDADGKVRVAEFVLNAGMYDRFSYLYDPGNEVSKEPNPDTIVTEEVGGGWWFLSEDWN